MHDKPIRSVVKAFSWRVTGTVDTMVVSFVVTGRLATALAIGGVEFFTKMLLYYIHERAWNKLKFGRTSEDVDYTI